MKYKKEQIPWNKGLTKEIDERVKKYSEKKSGENHPFYGKNLSEEHKIKIGNSLKEAYAIGLRESRRGYKASEETKKKMSESMKGKNNWSKGMHHSEGTRKKLSEKTKGHFVAEETKRKISEIKKRMFAEGKLFVPNNIGRKHSEEFKKKIRRERANQIFPIKDTSIEIKIQNFLKQLRIEFFTHQYMHIEHGYQCDIFIPSIKLIIECDGDYWHGNRNLFQENELSERILKQKELDETRTKELREKGYRVIRLWEHDIKKMELRDFKNKFLGDKK